MKKSRLKKAVTSWLTSYETEADIEYWRQTPTPDIGTGRPAFGRTIDRK